MSITLDGSNAGTVGVLNSGTAVATTSGTFVDYTGIPAGVKRITIAFNGVSLSASASVLIQIGIGSTPTTSTYVSGSGLAYGTNQTVQTSSTAGFIMFNNNAVNLLYGTMTLHSIGGNIWVSSHAAMLANGGLSGGGTLSLGGTLGMVRITSSNGTDTFDAGSVNIFWE